MGQLPRALGRALVLVCVLALAGVWALRAPVNGTQQAAAVRSPAAGAPVGTSWASSGSPGGTGHPAAGDTGAGETGPREPGPGQLGAGGAGESAALAGPGRAPDTDGAALTGVVVGLVQARDEAIMEADARALAATSVEGSAAAQADAGLLAALEAAGERVEGLGTRVSGLRVLTEEEVPPGATAVALTRSQGASVRVGADGRRRTVPAQPPRRVVLVLLPGPWRVLEVRDATGAEAGDGAALSG